MSRNFGILGSIALLLGAGYYHGISTDRWTPRGASLNAIAQLETIPRQIGDWKGVDQEMKLEELAGAGIRGGLTRIYTNDRKGERITMMILYGKANQLSVHTPDICYPAAGYEQIGGATRVEIAAPAPTMKGAFWANTFRRPDRPTLDELTVHYAWGVDHSWRAPDGDARLSFAWYPGIYKMYIVQAVSKPNAPVDSGASVDFLNAALPVLDQTLFSTL